MAVPIQLPTNTLNETFAGVTYHIEGELVPVLHLELSSVRVYFEHHILCGRILPYRGTPPDEGRNSNACSQACPSL